MATPNYLGTAIRQRVEAQMAAMRARETARRTVATQRAEAMHSSIATAEAAIRDLGSHVVHDFTAGNPQGAADAIRNAVESSVTRAKQAGFHVDVQNTGGITRVGRS